MPESSTETHTHTVNGKASDITVQKQKKN